MASFDNTSQHKFKSKGAIIAEELLSKIRSGEYSAGSRLPAERWISEQMGVSRPSVREAISALHIIGVIESRPGDGSYVSEMLDFGGLSYQLKNIFDESDSPYEILQARRVFETGAVRLAIEEANEEDIQQITEVWEEKLKLGLSGEHKAYTQMGNKLHLTIAKASKNRIVIAMNERLLDITDQPLWPRMRGMYLDKNPAQLERSIDIHARLIKAIQERNSFTAIVVVEEHFNCLIEQLYDHNLVKE